MDTSNALSKQISVDELDEHVPIDRWSKDHWSTLAYIETVMVDCGGFQVGLDARMKTNRRNFRVFHERCPHPKRPWPTQMAMSMNPEHATRLKDGSQVASHDDWACLQDMAAAGFFNETPEDIDVGMIVTLSDKGRAVANALRDHKANGGQFAEFEAPSL